MRVPNNRQECCHVAGDIDFDKHGNLWLVTGDDTPAGGINAGGYGPFNTQKTDEQQTVRVTNATGGTFTLTFNGQTTAPIAYNATAAQVDAALEALSNIEAEQDPDERRPGEHGERQRVLPARASSSPTSRRSRPTAPALTGATRRARPRRSEGGWYQRLTGDSAPQRAEHERPARQGAAHQGQGRDITAADANKADFGTRRRRVHDPGRQPVPARRGRAAGQDPARGLRDGLPQPVPDPGRRERRRVRQRLLAGRATRRSAAADRRGVGRFEIVRKPSNYGWPTCYKRDLAYYQWNFHEFAPEHDHGGHAAAERRRSCTTATARRSATTRCGTSRAARRSSPACVDVPPVTDPDIWYSYRDNNTATRRSARRAWATTRRPPGPIAPGSTTECPRLFPELYTGGVGPHGMTKYNYDPANPNPKKFPPYYDDSVIFGEWTQDTLREMKLDEQNRIQKINSFLDCGSRANTAAGTFLFECDNPMDMQFGCRRRVLPADLRQRVQRHQPGRRHVQVGVRQGQARAEGRADHRQDRRRLAADGQLLQRRLAGRGSGRLDPLRVGLR